ncbi:MAG: hypothetical protein ACERKU_09165 [Nitrospirota bacterium]
MKLERMYELSPTVAQHVESAKLCREWLESLAVDVELRNALVEPIRVLEEAFQDIVDQPR